MAAVDMIGDLVKNLGLTDQIEKMLVNELKKIGAQALVGEASKLASRALLKGIDGVAAAAVKHMSDAQAQAFANEFVSEVVGLQYDQLLDAFKAYVPLAVAVEMAKEKHGSNSAQANAARALRQTGINEMRQEVKDVLLASMGSAPAD